MEVTAEDARTTCPALAEAAMSLIQFGKGPGVNISLGSEHPFGDSAFSRRLENPACDGDAQDGCSCLLGCDVFGGDDAPCDSTEMEVEVNNAVKRSIDRMCDGMKCVVHCAKKMNCLGDVIKERCAGIKEQDLKCDVDCDAATRRWGDGPTFLLLGGSGIVALRCTMLLLAGGFVILP